MEGKNPDGEWVIINNTISKTKEKIGEHCIIIDFEKLTKIKHLERKRTTAKSICNDFEEHCEILDFRILVCFREKFKSIVHFDSVDKKNEFISNYIYEFPEIKFFH